MRLSFIPQSFNINSWAMVSLVAYVVCATVTAKAEQDSQLIDPVDIPRTVGTIDDLVVTASMSGTRAAPNELLDGAGLIFKAKASYPICSQASLEVEIIPSGRPFIGQPTVKSDFTQQCPLTGLCKSLDLPSFEFMPPSGRVIKAQVRMRIKPKMVHFENRGGELRPVSCGVDRPELITAWEPYSKWLPASSGLSPLINIRDEWFDSVTHPADSIFKKGESTDELTELRAGDNNWYTTKSTATPPYEVQWIGHSPTISNIDAVTDGIIAMKVRSTPGCTQRIELQRSIGLGQKEWVEVLPRASIGPIAQSLTGKLPYDLRGFLWTSYMNEGRAGYMYWRVTCTGDKPFTHEFDLLGLGYRALGEVRATD